MEEENEIQTFANIEETGLYKNIYDNEGNNIGIMYDPGYEPDFMNYIYPTFCIYIMRDKDIIDLSSAQIKLQLYNYDLENYQIGDLYLEIEPSANGNYFEFRIPNEPNQMLLKLTVYETDWKIYELQSPILGVKTAGTAQYQELYASLVEEIDENQTFLQKFLSPILDGITWIVEFFMKFGDFLMEQLKNGLEITFIPEEEFLEQWSTNMKTKIEEEIPILAIPIRILDEFINGHFAQLQEQEVGLNWNAIIINDMEYFPAGSIDLKLLIESNEHIQKAHDT